MDEAGESGPPSLAERAKHPLLINGNQSWPEWGGGVTGNTPIGPKANTTKLSYHICNKWVNHLFCAAANSKAQWSVIPVAY